LAAFFRNCDDDDLAEPAGYCLTGHIGRITSPVFFMNSLGTLMSPEAVSFQSRLVASQRLQAGSGSFRIIRFIVVPKKGLLPQ
jgi:hypothetical protein